MCGQSFTTGHRIARCLQPRPHGAEYAAAAEAFASLGSASMNRTELEPRWNQMQGTGDRRAPSLGVSNSSLLALARWTPHALHAFTPLGQKQRARTRPAAAPSTRRPTHRRGAVRNGVATSMTVPGSLRPRTSIFETNASRHAAMAATSGARRPRSRRRHPSGSSARAARRSPTSDQSRPNQRVARSRVFT